MPQHFGVIFDMDGVLIDSFEPHYQSWLKLGEQHGFSLSRQEFNRTFGRTSREVIREWFPAVATSAAKVAELDLTKEVLFRTELEGNFPVMDGAPELIRLLDDAKFQLAIGSSGPVDNVSLTIRKLGIRAHLKAIVSGSDVSKGKPDPEIFLTAADKLGLLPQSCLVVEDSEPGVVAAIAAGMVCIGLISTGHADADTAAAHMQVHSLSQITPKLVANLISDTNL